MAAGSGSSAVKGLNGASPEAKSGIKPQPPTSAPSGRPNGSKRREECSGDSGQQMWQGIFQEIADSPISKEDCVKCAAVATMCQGMMSQVVSVCLASGLQEEAVRRVLQENIFKSAPNPQDGGDLVKTRSIEATPGESEIHKPPAKMTRSNTNKRNSAHVRAVVPGGTEPRRCTVTKLKLDTTAMCRHIEGHPSEVYDSGHALGEGTFGSVSKARHRQTGQIHAMKSVPKHKVEVGALWAEIDIMKQLDHPHIMRLYYTFQDEDCIYMASEMCGGGELYDTLDETGFFPEAIAANLMRQILSTMNYLHCSKSIAHRDLKPENFLVLQKVQNEVMHLKLIDFGTAKRFDLHPLKTKVCTVHYVAPEVLKRGDQVYTEKVDMWSCGVILYMMLCGFMPFHHDDSQELLKLVKKGKFIFSPSSVWGHISEQAKDLITRLMCIKVPDRLSASDAFRHEWTQKEVDDKGSFSTHPAEDIVKSMRQFLTHNRLKRVVLQIIARQINDSFITKLRDIFAKIDADNSGTLSFDEMDQALQSLDANEKQRGEMAKLMRTIDVEGSGELEYTEFLATMLKKDQYLKEDILRGAFHCLDVDGDGRVSPLDLQMLLTGGQVALSKAAIEEIDQILCEVDENGDGGIDFEEFWKIMAEDGPAASSAVIALRWQGHGKKETKLNLDDGTLLDDCEDTHAGDSSSASASNSRRPSEN